MVALYNQLVSDLRMEKLERKRTEHLHQHLNEDEVVIYSGRNLIRQLTEELNRLLLNPRYPNGEKCYLNFYEKYKHHLSHYFRNLYRIYKIVDEANFNASSDHNSDYNKEKKKFYTGIIRAQLSNDELILLFYNCIYGHGQSKFKPLAKRYDMFDNMPEEDLHDPSLLEKHFS